MLGTWLLTRLDNRPLALAVAALVWPTSCVTAAAGLSDPSLPGACSWPGRSERWAAWSMAPPATAGRSSGRSSIASGLSRSSFVFALTVPFLVFGAIQVLTLVGLGAFTPDRTAQALWAILPVLVVIPVGTRIARRLNQRAFERIVMVLLAFAAVRLVLSAFGI